MEEAIQPLLNLDLSKEPRICAALSLFEACLEDIHSQMSRLTKRDRQLAMRIMEVLLFDFRSAQMSLNLSV